MTSERVRIDQLLRDPDTTIALVGATDNPAKYGNRIFKDLRGKGFTVWPVNPQRDTVEGEKAYATVDDLPGTPDIVDFVVPPRFTLHVLKQCLELGYMNVWIQPGAESPEVLEFLDQNDFNYLAGACIMVEAPAHV